MSPFFTSHLQFDQQQFAQQTLGIDDAEPIFKAAIESEQYVLAVIGVLNAAIAAYYYLRVIMTMYMREPETDELPPEGTPRPRPEARPARLIQGSTYLSTCSPGPPTGAGCCSEPR